MITYKRKRTCQFQGQKEKSAWQRWQRWNDDGDQWSPTIGWQIIALAELIATESRLSLLLRAFSTAIIETWNRIHFLRNAASKNLWFWVRIVVRPTHTNGHRMRNESIDQEKERIKIEYNQRGEAAGTGGHGIRSAANRARNIKFQ